MEVHKKLIEHVSGVAGWVQCEHPESGHKTTVGALLRAALTINETLRPSPGDLARLFHETYEKLAPSFGYETREASRKPWEQVPENNRKLMTAVCAEILAGMP